MQMRKMVAVVLMAMALLCPLTAYAQDKPADNMQIVLEKIRADKKLLVATNMKLTESEATAFWPLYNEYQSELFLLRSRTLGMIGEYAEAYEKMSDGRAKKLLDDLMTIEEIGLKLRKTYLPKFRGILPDIKVVRYYQIENKVNAALMYEFASKIPLIKGM